MAHSITILTSYFGEFNNYFNLWLKSVEYNNTVNFKLLTDNSVTSLPSNVELVQMSFQEMQKKVRSFFDFPVVINDGYKMSEYQPLFALIFPELVQNSDFWGYCEMDLILGDLRNFFTDEILNKYEKIYWLGHLTLFKNNEKMNSLAMLDHKYPTATYRQAFSTPYNYHFIEGGAMRGIAKYSGCKCYEEIEFADISFRYFNFTLARGKDMDNPQIYRWKNGKAARLYLKDDNIVEEEVSYIHLQKRKMENKADSIDDGFLIVPNSFINTCEITKEFIVEHSQNTEEWKKWHRKFWRDYYIKTIKQGGFKIKLDKIIRKILYSKNV